MVVRYGDGKAAPVYKLSYPDVGLCGFVCPGSESEIP